MKKFILLILLSLLCFNFSIADENKELKLFQDYKERLFESALKEDLKQVEKICTNYKSEKEKIIFEDEYQEMRLDWLCEGGLSHIFNMITYEYNDKLLDESLSHIDVCNEYKKIPLDESQYDQMGINTHMGIMNYCETVELRASFKQDAKHNLIKDLDLEKLNFNFLSNKFYSLTIPENEITKKSSCHLNLKKEKRLMDYGNACFVFHAQPLVLLIGGMVINIWDLRYFYKHIGGLQIVEMKIQMKDWML